MFTGSDEPRSYAADKDDYVLVGRSTVDRLGAIDAVLAYFDATEFAVPPLRIADGEMSGPV